MWGVPDLALSLEDYAEYLGMDECHVYGITKEDDPLRGCRTYWNQTDRIQLANSIAKAIERYEYRLGYPLAKKFIESETPDYRCPLKLKWGYFREVGIKATASIQAGVVLALADTVSFDVTVGFTDPCELIVYYPGQTRYAIKPSSVVISGVTATVEIPKCRLLDPDYFVDYASDHDRPAYEVDSNFITSVDVGRVYTDTTQGAYLSFLRGCDCLCGGCLAGCSCGCDCTPTAPCGVAQQSACGRADDRRIGTLRIEPANYENGVWKAASLLYNRYPDKIIVNYTAGYYAGTPSACIELMYEDKRAIIALAHLNLPQAMCSCDIHKKYFIHDNENLAERLVLNNPWGSTKGAWEAWQIMLERKLGEGGLLGWP